STRSEKSSSATVPVLRNSPLPNTLVACRTSINAVMPAPSSRVASFKWQVASGKSYVTRLGTCHLPLATPSVQVARNEPRRSDLAQQRLLRGGAVERPRATRAEGAPWRAVEERGRQTGNPLERPLLLERRQTGDQELAVGVERCAEEIADR